MPPRKSLRKRGRGKNDAAPTRRITRSKKNAADNDVDMPLATTTEAPLPLATTTEAPHLPAQRSRGTVDTVTRAVERAPAESALQLERFVEAEPAALLERAEAAPIGIVARVENELIDDASTFLSNGASRILNTSMAPKVASVVSTLTGAVPEATAGILLGPQAAGAVERLHERAERASERPSAPISNNGVVSQAPALSLPIVGKIAMPECHDSHMSIFTIEGLTEPVQRPRDVQLAAQWHATMAQLAQSFDESHVFRSQLDTLMDQVRRPRRISRAEFESLDTVFDDTDLHVVLPPPDEEPVLRNAYLVPVQLALNGIRRRYGTVTQRSFLARGVSAEDARERTQTLIDTVVDPVFTAFVNELAKSDLHSLPPTREIIASYALDAISRQFKAPELIGRLSAAPGGDFAVRLGDGDNPQLTSEFRLHTLHTYGDTELLNGVVRPWLHRLRNVVLADDSLSATRKAVVSFEINHALRVTSRNLVLAPKWNRIKNAIRSPSRQTIESAAAELGALRVRTWRARRVRANDTSTRLPYAEKLVTALRNRSQDAEQLAQWLPGLDGYRLLAPVLWPDLDLTELRSLSTGQVAAALDAVKTDADDNADYARRLARAAAKYSVPIDSIRFENYTENDADTEDELVPFDLSAPLRAPSAQLTKALIGRVREAGDLFRPRTAVYYSRLSTAFRSDFVRRRMLWQQLAQVQAHRRRSLAGAPAVRAVRRHVFNPTRIHIEGHLVASHVDATLVVNEAIGAATKRIVERRNRVLENGRYIITAEVLFEPIDSPGAPRVLHTQPPFSVGTQPRISFDFELNDANQSGHYWVRMRGTARNDDDDDDDALAQDFTEIEQLPRDFVVESARGFFAFCVKCARPDNTVFVETENRSRHACVFLDTTLQQPDRIVRRSQLKALRAAIGDNVRDPTHSSLQSRANTVALGLSFDLFHNEFVSSAHDDSVPRKQPNHNERYTYNGHGTWLFVQQSRHTCSASSVRATGPERDAIVAPYTLQAWFERVSQLRDVALPPDAVDRLVGESIDRWIDARQQSLNILRERDVASLEQYRRSLPPYYDDDEFTYDIANEFGGFEPPVSASYVRRRYGTSYAHKKSLAQRDLVASQQPSLLSARVDPGLAVQKWMGAHKSLHVEPEALRVHFDNNASDGATCTVVSQGDVPLSLDGHHTKATRACNVIREHVARLCQEYTQRNEERATAIAIWVVLFNSVAEFGLDALTGDLLRSVL